MGSLGRDILGAKVKRIVVERSDKNSKFFQKMANARRRKNFLSSYYSGW